MQKVPQWSVATLDGTFNFKNNWDGYHTHMFIFKYSSSSSASTLWGASPGSYLRKMPDNVHVFWGSFDSSYHNDVVQMKSNVLAALSPQEEQEWQGRLHFIDIQGQTITGGLGDMISNFGNPFAMGIDRFQLSRETGSLYAWTSQSNDASHIAYESQQWNVEYPVKVRENDPNVHVVTLADFANHQGGWSSGHSSRWDVSFDLTRDLSSFDTLEVYHEHACDERKNRYQDSQGNYQGCHEWDYLANLYICDVDNSSKCNQEIMRWITTYGREGMWLTDISPYLFMLENDFHHYFRYAGANGGDMTIKFLFSDWGSGEQGREGVYAFSGGQFDGTYNDESKYNRQLNFTVPSWAQSVKIVATITGHGFNKDNANCAEFCDHEHHYFMNSQTTYEWHPIVHDSEGCEKEVGNGVVANQFGSWPFGRAGWCAGQDVKQWTYDISSWSDMQGGNNHLTYKGYFNGQEYVPSDGIGNGARQIRAVIWVVFYDTTTQA